MTTRIDLNALVDADQIAGDSPEDTLLLNRMLQSATDYVSSFQWCPPIRKTYFGGGTGGVVAVFLFEFSEKVQGTDELLWVIDGDLPSTYLVTDDCPNPPRALERYCELMNEWALAVLNNGNMDGAFPVAAVPTIENASNLLDRIEFLRTKILPGMRVNRGQSQ